ncbi:MAG: hypothetical protein DHS20C12_20300 [Pseudohongiella sp.]|nr:MAG: hypothetical protein DHS20C12_20300 [Pseudohongiella sp.]
MIWLTAIACLVVGVVIGVVFSSRLNSNASRVQDLENQIRDLKDNHLTYRDNVSDHFSMTADLVQHMTESYREVYQHLASGAQDLCSNDVASKLLPAGSDAVFESNEETESTGGLNPPKDYAAKQDPSQKGALSEEFGINKTMTQNEEEAANTPKH